MNGGLRDLIQILLIRELLNRRRPPFRPPMPNPPGPGPRPPMRPPFGPGPGRPPFNRDFDSFNDLYDSLKKTIDIIQFCWIGTQHIAGGIFYRFHRKDFLKLGKNSK